MEAAGGIPRSPEEKPVGGEGGSTGSAVADVVRAALGGLVVGIALLVLSGIALAAFDALPTADKGKNVLAIVGSVTTVIGTMVGTYVGARVGATGATETARGAERSRAVEGIRLQEALGALGEDKAAGAMRRADERVKQTGLARS